MHAFLYSKQATKKAHHPTTHLPLAPAMCKGATHCCLLGVLPHTPLLNVAGSVFLWKLRVHTRAHIQFKKARLAAGPSQAFSCCALNASEEVRMVHVSRQRSRSRSNRESLEGKGFVFALLRARSCACLAVSAPVVWQSQLATCFPSAVVLPCGCN